jgi:hypothetical protein
MKRAAYQLYRYWIFFWFISSSKILINLAAACWLKNGPFSLLPTGSYHLNFYNNNNNLSLENNQNASSIPRLLGCTYWLLILQGEVDSSRTLLIATRTKAIHQPPSFCCIPVPVSIPTLSFWPDTLLNTSGCILFLAVAYPKILSSSAKFRMILPPHRAACLPLV